MSGALVTDLYQLNMAASYLRRRMTGPATFSLFVRSLPESRGFLVAAGLEDCLRYLETFAFGDQDCAWLRGQGFPPDSVDQFANLRFSGDVFAVPEGRVVFANEPLLEVTAPLAEGQLVETFLLNQMTFQSAVATKAARCQIAAGDITLIDFSLRRSHGTEAGLAVARLSAIAGFSATSNVEAAQRFGLRPAGTMAHSYIEAFPSEHAAFRAFAEDLPGRTTFLVDTYDPDRGVQTAIDVIRSLSLSGDLAVRLDSGDLVELARRTRARLDDASLPHVQILVSGGLDEYDLERFRMQGAPIDAAGIGTRLGVSADAPFLDSAYKLVAYDGRPVVKLSPGKATLPGAKQVWRRLAPHTPIETGADLLAERDEPGPSGSEPLLLPVMRGGARLGAADTIAAACDRLSTDVTRLPPRVLDLHHPTPIDVTVSPRLRALADQLGADLSTGTAEGTPP